MELMIKGMKKSFGEKAVLKGAEFTFRRGKIYGLLGRNGAGKTTLFNCLSGEMEPESGRMLLTYPDPISGTEKMKRLTADDIGYVFSTPILPEFMTGYEFIKFFLDISKATRDESKGIEDYFDLVKIEAEDRHRLIKGYSHGMKNKLQMLCFIISKPPVILLDEPLTSFDVVVALEMKKLLRSMKEDHIIIFSTHILQLATDLCDEIVILSRGTLEQVSHEKLHSGDFEEIIVKMMKEEDDGHGEARQREEENPDNEAEQGQNSGREEKQNEENA